MLAQTLHHERTNDTPLPGAPYPVDFEQYIKVMMKRLFRVFAHIYHSHSHEISALSLEDELNVSFMRFMEYVWCVYVPSSGSSSSSGDGSGSSAAAAAAAQR